MEEALYGKALLCEIVGPDAGESTLPDESIVLRLRHLLETHNLSLQIQATINAMLVATGSLLESGTVVDTKLIAAPISTKNNNGERNPEMLQTKKGHQWHSEMKAHIGLDADSGRVHTAVGTAANVNDVTTPGQAPGNGQRYADGRDHREAGAGHGAHPGLSRIPVSSNQAPVRACEAALPGAGQERGAAAHAVCTLKPVDGAAHIAAGDPG